MRHFSGHTHTKDVDVSIHASVKDATQFRGFSYKEIIVSIHASVKDATIFVSVVNAGL